MTTYSHEEILCKKNVPIRIARIRKVIRQMLSLLLRFQLFSVFSYAEQQTSFTSQLCLELLDLAVDLFDRVALPSDARRLGVAIAAAISAKAWHDKN